MNMTSHIKVKNSFIGYHRYENATPDVAFLEHWHRHTFHVHTKASVTHDDREIEFYDLQQTIKDFVSAHFDIKKVEATKGFLGEIAVRSCEMLAKDIIGHLILVYGERHYEVEVWEDLECAGIVEYAPSKNR